MSGRSFRFLGFATVAFAFAGIGLTSIRAEERSKPTIKIGLVSTLTKDVPDSLLNVMATPFSVIMEQQTGLKGTIAKGGDAYELGQQLMDGKVQLGIYNGIEFAWAKQRYPELRPLMVVVNQDHHLHAKLVVCKGKVAGMKDLAGQCVEIPKGPYLHCWLFLNRRCQTCGQCCSEKFLAKINTPANAEEAVDNVIDGTVSAAVVDGQALDCYKRRKPGRFKRLTVLHDSEVFPTAVVAYRKGALDESILARFRKGMAGANQTVMGRQLLTLWKITGFEPIPADYEKTLTNIVKAYPAP